MRLIRSISPFQATLLFSFLLHLALVLLLQHREGRVRYLLSAPEEIITVSMPLFKNLSFGHKADPAPAPKPKAKVEKPPEPAPLEKVLPEAEIPTNLPVQNGTGLPAAQTGAGDAAGTGTATVGDVGGLDNEGPYQPLYNPKPAYPPIALAANLEGAVEVEILVNEMGGVDSFTVLKTTGHPQFADAVKAVLPRWRFPPPRFQGKPVKVRFVYIIRFELD